MEHPNILDRLERGDVLISDGATGTYLQSRDLEPGGCPEASMSISRRSYGEWPPTTSTPGPIWC